MSSVVFRLAFAVSILVATSSEPVASLTLTYVGACAYNCNEEGLDVGAKAVGTVVIDDSGYSPDGFFGNEALIDFAFDLGGIRLDRASAAAYSFGGPWDVIPGAGLVWYLDASTSVDRFDLGPTISISGSAREGFGYASFLGTCEVDADSSCAVGFHTAAQFEMTGEAASIPLPGAGLLLLGSLGMVSGMRLRRR